MTNSTLISGWVDQPNGRGTFDIIWSCLFTIFLCIWSVQCLNLPARNENHWHVFKRKLKWALISIFGPEFLMTFANGQWAAATRSVHQFRESGHKDWTLTHAFFAEMGGFVIETHNTGTFPISSEQLHYLIEEGQVKYPSITLEDINDKSKGDVWTKSIIGLQTGWFLLEMLGRAITRSPVTTLELATGGFVICTMATNFFWYFKPQDVNKPITLKLEKPALWDNPEKEQLSLRRLTPLDFVDNLQPSWSMTVMPHLRMARTGPQERPMQRLPNDRLPRICVKCQLFLCFVTLLYGGCHLIGWNFDFPSKAEKMLWRITSSLQIGMTAAFWIADESQRLAQKKFNGPGTMQKLHAEIEAKKKLATEQGQSVIGSESSLPVAIEKTADAAVLQGAPAPSINSDDIEAQAAVQAEEHGKANLAAETNEKDESGSDIEPDVPRVNTTVEALLYTVPRWQLITIGAVVVIYAIARAYLIVEVFAGLRVLPSGAFEQVQWSAALPHSG
jgi:hypothetical protein